MMDSGRPDALPCCQGGRSDGVGLFGPSRSSHYRHAFALLAPACPFWPHSAHPLSIFPLHSSSHSQQQTLNKHTAPAPPTNL